jgi:phosphate transport system permease protein
MLLLGFLAVHGVTSIDLALFFGDTPWLDAVLGKRAVFGGIWPALVGTFSLVVLSSVVSIPIGIASGIYLVEYASDRWRSLLGFMVDLLSGTPSIVMGLFGFTIILALRKTFLPGARTGLLLAAVCIGLLILPYVIRTTESALDGIPEHFCLLGPSLGLTRWQNMKRVLLPVASRGILSGAILAIGRAAEDTAVILLTGAVAHAGIPGSLVDKFEALPFRIYYLAAEHRNQQELDQGFATALVLLFLTGLLFLTAVLLQRSVERRWKARW